MISSSRQPLVLTPGRMSIAQLKLIHQHQQFIALPESCRSDIRKSQVLVEAYANGDVPVYGVNTGFGKLANQRINKEQLHTLQLNLIRSHSVGVGEPLTAPIIRLMMATKAAGTLSSTIMTRLSVPISMAKAMPTEI